MERALRGSVYTLSGRVLRQVQPWRRLSLLSTFFTGRTVKVKDDNLQEAIQKLDSILSQNRVRRELRLTERHEKKGVKRRRLSSERWRTFFANEVRSPSINSALILILLAGSQESAASERHPA